MAILAQVEEFEGRPNREKGMGFERVGSGDSTRFRLLYFRDGEIHVVGDVRQSVGEDSVNVSDGEGGWIESPFRLVETEDGTRILVASVSTIDGRTIGELSELHLKSIGPGSGEGRAAEMTRDGLALSSSTSGGAAGVHRNSELTTSDLTIDMTVPGNSFKTSYSATGILSYRGDEQTFGMDRNGIHWDEEANPSSPQISSDNGIVFGSWKTLNPREDGAITTADQDINNSAYAFMVHDGSDDPELKIKAVLIKSQDEPDVTKKSFGVFTPHSKQVENGEFFDANYTPASDELITKSWFDRNKSGAASIGEDTLNVSDGNGGWRETSWFTNSERLSLSGGQGTFLLISGANAASTILNDRSLAISNNTGDTEVGMVTDIDGRFVHGASLRNLENNERVSITASGIFQTRSSNLDRLFNITNAGLWFFQSNSNPNFDTDRFIGSDNAISIRAGGAARAEDTLEGVIKLEKVDGDGNVVATHFQVDEILYNPQGSDAAEASRLRAPDNVHLQQNPPPIDDEILPWARIRKAFPSGPTISGRIAITQVGGTIESSHDLTQNFAQFRPADQTGFSLQLLTSDLNLAGNPGGVQRVSIQINSGAV